MHDRPARAWSTPAVIGLSLVSTALGAALATYVLLRNNSGESAWRNDDKAHWVGSGLDCPGGIFCQLPVPFEQGQDQDGVGFEITKATMQGTTEPTLALEGRVRALADIRLDALEFTLLCTDDKGQSLGEARHRMLSIAPVQKGDTTPFNTSVSVPPGTVRVRLAHLNPTLVANPPRFDATPVEPTWKAPRPVNAALSFRIRQRTASAREVTGIVEVENQGPANLTSLKVEVRNAGGEDKAQLMIASAIFPPMLAGERRVDSYRLAVTEDVGKEDFTVIEAQ